MVPTSMLPASTGPAHAHGHDHGPALAHRHHPHGHVHDLASPHPPHAAAWSILRMTVTGRLFAALAVCAGLWTMVWLAMK